MNDLPYVCLGSCQAQISKEEYKNGLVACGNHTCEYKGKPFVKGDKCSFCRKTYAEEEKHQH